MLTMLKTGCTVRDAIRYGANTQYTIYHTSYIIHHTSQEVAVYKSKQLEISAKAESIFKRHKEIKARQEV
ncbi:hypothetical protein EON63_22420 [archaeon]|nr:MAG: hypothetical protein EON63_22420 [archaeon]